MNSKMAVCLLCAVAVAIPTFSRADEATPAPASETSTSAPSASPKEPDWKQMYEEQKKRNDELEKRISLLEEKDKTPPYVKSEDVKENTLKFLQGVELSGFASASYTYNFNQPADRLNGGQIFDTQHDEFMFNKVVVILDSPVDYNPFDWKAGFYTELVLGQDARGYHSVSPDNSNGLFNIGDNGDLLQAYVQFNIPVGNGVKVVFGKYATPVGYELNEQELNPNWSLGYQFTYLEPFTHTGLQIGYKIDDAWEVQLLINQGWDNVKDNNQSKSFMGHVNYTPNDATWVGFTLFGGPEQSDFRNDPANAVPGANGHWRYGLNAAMTHHCTPKLLTALQADWGEEQGGGPNGGTAVWYGFGMWMVYDWTEKVQTALRADFISDEHGNRTSDFLFPVNNGQDVWSLTLTLNYKPVEGLRIAPEIRYDHSSLNNAFDGHRDQVLTSIAAVYSY
jgi:hypothetical protein